jgi:hypothetical protein
VQFFELFIGLDEDELDLFDVESHSFLVDFALFLLCLVALEEVLVES